LNTFLEERIHFVVTESPAGSSVSEVEEHEERMVLEDQPLISEAIATLVAEVISQADQVSRKEAIKGSLS
jgi:hypothetical protein